MAERVSEPPLSPEQAALVNLIRAKGIRGVPLEQRNPLLLFGPVYLAACPKKEYLAACGRPNRTVIDQGQRYELPYKTDVKAIDLRAVIRWVHDFLARNGKSLNSQKSVEEEAFDVADNALKKEMAEECIRQKQLANTEKEINIKKKLGELFPFMLFEEWRAEASRLFSSSINAAFGGQGMITKAEALERMNDLLEDFNRLAEEKFGDGGKDSQTAA